MVDTATTKMAPVSPVLAARQGYWRGVFRRLLRDPGGLIVGAIILLLLALALFGPWLIVKDPYQTSMFYALNLSAATALYWVLMNSAAICCRA